MSDITPPPSEGQDFSLLRTPEARDAFYGEVLNWRWSRDGTVPLAQLRSYAIYLQVQLHEKAGLDFEEAGSEAAKAVFSGLARYLRQHTDLAGLPVFDEMDQELRQQHGIDSRVNPWNHADPTVAAFYSELDGHLRHNPSENPDV